MRCKAPAATQCEHCEQRATPQSAGYGSQNSQEFMRTYLDKLKSEKLILDWRLKQQARAGVQKTIRDLFRTLPQPYTVDLRQEKAARAYGFVYDTYPGGARPGMHA